MVKLPSHRVKHWVLRWDKHAACDNGPMTAGMQKLSACLQESRGGGCPPARLTDGTLLLLCSHACRPISEVNVLPDVLRLITAQPTSKRPLQTKTIHTPWSVEEAHLPASALGEEEDGEDVRHAAAEFSHMD